MTGEKDSHAETAAPLRCGCDTGDEPRVTLAEVDILPQLASRASRPPRYDAEDHALALLARELARSPTNVLAKLAVVAGELCDADSAGISLLEGHVFRWEAVAGGFAPYRHGTMPRAASPCGVTIDRDATQLMSHPARCFPALRGAPHIVEAMLVPFRDGGTPIGTVWVVMHGDRRQFDREDERIVRVLAHFASAAWHLWVAANAPTHRTIGGPRSPTGEPAPDVRPAV